MIERTCAFGDGGNLVGTFCVPEEGVPRADLGLVLFNAGFLHRVGPHRINVRMARALAKRGIASLRFDLAGQGDSEAPGRREYRQGAVADLAAAMSELGREAGVTRFVLFGFCSGGFHSYDAAQADDRIAGILLYDAFAYRTLRTRLNRMLMVVRSKGWRGAFAGVLAALARAFRRGNDAAQPPSPEFFLSFKPPPRREFAATAGALLDRGVKIGMIYSGSFPRTINYEEQLRDALAGTRAAQAISCRYFAGADHTATTTAMQAQLVRYVEEWVVELAARRRAART